MSKKQINRNDPCLCGSGKKYKHCCLSATEVRSLKPPLPSQLAPDILETAISHHRAGHLEQAEDLYRTLLRMQPDHPDALHLLGVIAHQKDEHAQAAELIGKAISLQPSAAMYGNLALVVQAMGDLDDAIRMLRQALDLDPQHAESYNNLGMALQTQGKLSEAIECFLQAIAHKPDYSGAYCNLGIAAHDLGHLDEAVRCYRIALSFAPSNTGALNNLGNVLREQGDCEAAIRHFEIALSLNPQHPLTYSNLGNIARDRGQPELAIDLYKKTLSLDASLANIHSDLLFALLNVSGLGPDEVFAEHLQYARQFEASLKPFWPTHHNLRDKHKRLKIGYVSGDFRNHAVAYFFEPILTGHDKSQVEVFCYYNHHQDDEITRRFAALADHWIPCKGMTDETLAAHIREDGIDILVDLSGHTAYNRLLTFARKPAPIQITWIGYPTTTGLAAMDYRLTDAIQDPPGFTEQYHSETLLRLPMAGHFKPAAIRPPINPLPALAAGVFTFACLNNLAKITEEIIALWAHILLALPQARLMLGNVNDGTTRQKLLNSFASHGIAEHRLVLHPKMALRDYLALHHQIDLALDPFPYTGGTTSYHALSMGVPVITLAGDSPVSRCGAGIMVNAGLSEFVAADKEEYLQLAVQFANDLLRLDRIRQSLRNGCPNLYDPQASTYSQDLEQLFRQVWMQCCDA